MLKSPHNRKTQTFYQFSELIPIWDPESTIKLETSTEEGPWNSTISIYSKYIPNLAIYQGKQEWKRELLSVLIVFYLKQKLLQFVGI